MPERKYTVECRHLKDVALELPCNYVKDGFCGIDGRRCNLVLVAK
jgi:hypothetical protein